MWTHMAEGPCPAIGKTCNKPNHVCCHAVKLTYMTSWNCTQTRHRVAPIDIPVTDTLWYMCISQHHWWNRSNTKKYKNIVAHVCVWIWLTVLGQFINVGSKHVQSMLFLLLLSSTCHNALPYFHVLCHDKKRKASYFYTSGPMAVYSSASWYKSTWMNLYKIFLYIYTYMRKRKDIIAS